jgi:hypothetical protein
VFGTSPRDGGGPKRDGPGPGNYFKLEVPGKSAISTVRTVPAFTLRAREKFGSVDDTGTKEFPGTVAPPCINGRVLHWARCRHMEEGAAPPPPSPHKPNSLHIAPFLMHNP